MKEDLSGRTFFKLKILKHLTNEKNFKVECICDCGNYKICAANDLKRGRIKSCGCWKKPREEKTAQERFMRYVQKTDTCWIWKGSTRKTGYGQFHANKKNYIASRFSYLIFKGDIKENMYVLHKCDNPLCVNPDHLWLGSQYENMMDAKRKGRMRSVKGEERDNAKLNDNDVRKIRNLYKNPFKLRELSIFFEVSKTLILDVINRKAWAHIE